MAAGIPSGQSVLNPRMTGGRSKHVALYNKQDLALFGQIRH